MILLRGVKRDSDSVLLLCDYQYYLLIWHGILVKSTECGTRYWVPNSSTATYVSCMHP